jgi:hypothetical protein
MSSWSRLLWQIAVRSSDMATVLLVGLDPHLVPGVDAALVDQAIRIGQAQFDEAGIETSTCL